VAQFFSFPLTFAKIFSPDLSLTTLKFPDFFQFSLTCTNPDEQIFVHITDALRERKVVVEQ